MNFLIYPPLSPEDLAQVQAVSADLEIVNALTEEEALAAIPQAVGMYGDLTPALLERADSLAWLQTPIAGLEHYMFPALAESGIVVSNMAKIYSDMIADHAFCFILMFARGIHLYVRRQIEGVWRKGAPVRHLADCTLGVIGLGGIGSELARRAAAHDMRVIAVDARPDEELGKTLQLDALWPQERLHDLLTEADFAVSCVPQTPETVGLIGAAELARMKASSFLINVSRGVVVQLDALVQALEAGVIAGAALDVYETEPLPAAHPLWRMENVILTPHVAADNPHVPQRRIDTLRANLRRYLEGEAPANIVDKTRLF